MDKISRLDNAIWSGLCMFLKLIGNNLGVSMFLTFLIIYI